jgi:hypothetical protein
MPLKDQGLVEPEEERHQWVFHVAVSGRYAELREPKTLFGAQQDQDKVQDNEIELIPSISANSELQP